MRRKTSTRLLTSIAAAAATAMTMAAPLAQASSHREAPFITQSPKVDGTDFYLFRSYEAGRGDFTTIIANYVPLQDAYGGPNYFAMDPKALYEIHIDNNGDAVEDITYQFQFTNTYTGATIPIADDGDIASGDEVGTPVAIPLIQSGGVGPGAADTANLQVRESYQVTVVTGDRRSGTRSVATNQTAGGGTTFSKPVDNIGNKTIGDYEAYANGHIAAIGLPGCAVDGRVFVGQRREAFYLGLGEIFDLVNLNPLAARDSGVNQIADKNVTSIALEIPTACLTAGDETVIGGWTTASVRQARVQNPMPQGPQPSTGVRSATVEGGAWTQVSRLGSPLVNEVVIGLPDKDLFNASEPKDDVGNFGIYVLRPTLPALLELLFGSAGVEAPTLDPNGDGTAEGRSDLLAAFVTGITTNVGGNANFRYTAPAAGGAGEMLRMNTALAPSTTTAAAQSELAFLDCDLLGFPNGRRPKDDVVDIALTVVLGAITPANRNGLQTCDTSGATPVVVNPGVVVNDNVASDADLIIDAFPYLATPLPGSPTSAAQ